MSITVTGNDLYDVRQKIGYRQSEPAISVRWISDDYMCDEHCGCIVKDVRARVPVEFKDARSAILYIAKILKEHDAYAKTEIAKRKKEAAAQVKAKKK